MLLLRDCGGWLLFVYEWRLHFQSTASILRTAYFPELTFNFILSKHSVSINRKAMALNSTAPSLFGSISHLTDKIG
jgi:hypothetical protein